MTNTRSTVTRGLIHVPVTTLPVVSISTGGRNWNLPFTALGLWWIGTLMFFSHFCDCSWRLHTHTYVYTKEWNTDNYFLPVRHNKIHIYFTYIEISRSSHIPHVLHFSWEIWSFVWPFPRLPLSVSVAWPWPVPPLVVHSPVKSGLPFITHL